jgi:DNA-binding NtrC family response regulator
MFMKKLVGNAEEKLNILIVEDDEAVGSLMKEFFEEAGHKATLCEDYSSGATTFDANEYDVVVSDNNFPGGGGPTLIKHIQVKKPKQFVILATAASIKPLRKEFDHIKTVPAMSKPYKLKKLLRLIEGGVAYRRRQTLHGGNQGLHRQSLHPAP